MSVRTKKQTTRKTKSPNSKHKFIPLKVADPEGVLIELWIDPDYVHAVQSCAPKHKEYLESLNHNEPIENYSVVLTKYSLAQNHHITTLLVNERIEDVLMKFSNKS